MINKKNWMRRELSINRILTALLRGTLHVENIHKINLATWLRLVNFIELNISEFGFLNLDYMYISYHQEII